MSAYITSPFKPTPNAMTPGMPIYLWGNFNDKTGPTVGNVLGNSAAGTTATLRVQILGGNIPVVGALITVVGCANNAVFNVTNAAITAVSSALNPDAGIYNIQYAISSTTQAYTLDAGQFVVPQKETAEALAAGASVPAVMPFNVMGPNLNQALTAVVSFPSLPTSVIVYLQQAIFDIDSEYQTVCTVATVATGGVSGSPQVTVDPTLGRFFRFLNGTVVGGTSPSIIAKLIL